MKTISVAAVTAGGKTTVVRELSKRLDNSQPLHFYTFGGGVEDLKTYLESARPAFLQMRKDVLPSSDYVIDGSLGVDEIVTEILAKLA